MISPDRSLIETQLSALADLGSRDALIKRLDPSVPSFLATLVGTAEGPIIEELRAFHGTIVARLTLRAIFEHLAFRLVFSGDPSLSTAPKIRELLNDQLEVFAAKASGFATPIPPLHLSSLSFDAFDDHQLLAAWAECADLWSLQPQPHKDVSAVYRLTQAFMRVDDPMNALQTIFAGQASEIAANYLAASILDPLHGDMMRRDDPPWKR